MIFLPIVERELRVASRRAATYWLRFILGAGVFALWFLLLVFGPQGVMTSRGQMVFTTLSVIAFAFALLSGPLLTADSLSLERREGTLGLLFLTELRGYDVVLGKLIATSVHAFYGMAAILPLLCYSMLAGGVTGGESLRLGLVLLATLFFSLSAGMLVSAHARDARQALGGTLSLVIVLPCVLAGLGLVLGSLVKIGVLKFISWLSPIYLFFYAFDVPFQTRGGATQFDASLTFVIAGGGLMLFLAARHVTRAWRDKEETQEVNAEQPAQKRTSVLGPAFRSLRGESLSGDPYFWLAGRDRRPKQRLRVLLLSFCWVWLCFLGGSWLQGASARRVICFRAAVICVFLLHHGLKWLIAFESSRRLSEDRNSGALELLLVTPLTIDQIISGQQRALRDLFRGSIWLAICANVALFCLTAFVNPEFFSSGEIVLLAELYFGGAILMLVDFRALTLVGMWMALQTRRHTRAIQATLLRVMLVPWLAIFVLVLLTVGGGGLSSGMAMGMCLFWVGLAGILSHAFGSRAKTGLVEAFRQISAGPDATPAEQTFTQEPITASAAQTS